MARHTPVTARRANVCPAWSGYGIWRDQQIGNGPESKAWFEEE